MDNTTLSNLALLIITLLGMYLAAFWLALIIWTFRDHRARSRDGLASFAAALTVAVLNIPGLIVYLLLRPKETLSEAYERSLEEEALLQEIEEKPMCPGCGRPTHAEWQVCPHCHTTLKKPCIRCGNMLDLAWKICPYCATPQPSRSDMAAPRRPQAQPQEPSRTASEPPPRGQSLEFIEGDPYQG